MKRIQVLALFTNFIATIFRQAWAPGNMAPHASK